MAIIATIDVKYGDLLDVNTAVAVAEVSYVLLTVSYYTDDAGLWKRYLDTVGLFDKADKVIGKLIRTSATATDVASLSSSKPITSGSVATDKPSIRANVKRADSVIAGDFSTLGTGKPLKDSTSHTSREYKAVTKLIFDTAMAVDLVAVPDGVTFAYVKTSADSAFAESFTSVYTNKAIKDEGASVDNGLLIAGPSYTSQVYFAEFYVGDEYRYF
jgi:hypothetical protein